MARRRLDAPVASGIAKWLYRRSSQDVCPWNVRFARELLGMSQGEFSAAFRGSPMKRAKLRGLRRNAAVVLGNVGTAEDAAVLTRALGDEEPLVREHATWALARVRSR